MLENASDKVESSYWVESHLGTILTMNIKRSGSFKGKLQESLTINLIYI